MERRAARRRSRRRGPCGRAARRTSRTRPRRRTALRANSARVGVEVADRHQACPRVPKRRQDRGRRVDPAADDGDADVVGPVAVGDCDRLGRSRATRYRARSAHEEQVDLRRTPWSARSRAAAQATSSIPSVSSSITRSPRVPALPERSEHVVRSRPCPVPGRAELPVLVDVAQRDLLETVSDDREALLSARAGARDVAGVVVEPDRGIVQRRAQLLHLVETLGERPRVRRLDASVTPALDVSANALSIIAFHRAMSAGARCDRQRAGCPRRAPGARSRAASKRRTAHATRASISSASQWSKPSVGIATTVATSMPARATASASALEVSRIAARVHRRCGGWKRRESRPGRSRESRARRRSRSPPRAWR